MHKTFKGLEMLKQILAWTIAIPFVIGVLVVLIPAFFVAWAFCWILDTCKIPCPGHDKKQS